MFNHLKQLFDKPLRAGMSPVQINKRSMLDCAICLRETSTLTALSCSHEFCEDCITCWLALSNKCPICTTVVSKESPEYKAEVQQLPPCMDFTHDLHYLKQRLADARRRVNSKWSSSQNLKSNVSRHDAQLLMDEYKEAEDLYHVLSIMATEGGDNAQTVHLLETINFKLLDLQSLLSGGVSYSKQSTYAEEDYQEDFPELQKQVDKFEKKLSKGQRQKNNKAK